MPAGLDLDLDLEDNSSVVTDEQQEFSDFSIPSLELSDGLTAAASSMDVEDNLSLSCSGPGPETSSVSTEVPGVKEGLLEADGEAPSGGGKTNEDFFLGCFYSLKTVFRPLATGGAAAAASTGAECNLPAYYLVKWITWKEKKTPIITQSENGPCPLLAIMNTLFLRWKVALS